MKKILKLAIICMLCTSCSTLTLKSMDILLNKVVIDKSRFFKVIDFGSELIDTVDKKRGYTLKKFSYKNVLFYNYKKRDSKNAVVYVHGGGFMVNYVNSLRFSFAETITEKTKADFEVILVDMKGTKYPEQQDEVNVVLDYILPKYSKVIIIGDSAGGNIVLSALLKRRDEKKQLPNGIVLMSAWADLSNNVPSRRTNFNKDILLGKKPIVLLDDNPYARKVKDKRNPYVSPVYGDYYGFPKTLLQCGEDEVLKDDSALVYENMKENGIDAKLEIYKGMIHCFQLYPIFSKTEQAVKSITNFLEAIYCDKGTNNK